MSFNLPNEAAPFFWAFWIVFAALVLVVRVAFSVAVWHDAQIVKRRGHRVVFVHPALWALATLLGGVFVAVAYWVVHHSTLRGTKGAEAV